MDYIFFLGMRREEQVEGPDAGKEGRVLAHALGHGGHETASDFGCHLLFIGRR